MTEADAPDPMVNVMVLSSTVVETATSSPVEIVLVAIDQSDQVMSVLLALEVVAAWTGELPLAVEDDIQSLHVVAAPSLADEEVVLTPSLVDEEVVAAWTGELPLVVDEETQSLHVVSAPSLVDEEVVLSLTTSLVLVVVVVTALTLVSPLLVDVIQSDHVSVLPFELEDEVVTASTNALVVVTVAVELLFVSEVVVVDELVVAPSTGVSLLVMEDVQSDQVMVDSDVVEAASRLLEVVSALTTRLVVVFKELVVAPSTTKLVDVVIDQSDQVVSLLY